MCRIWHQIYCHCHSTPCCRPFEKNFYYFLSFYNANRPPKKTKISFHNSHIYESSNNLFKNTREKICKEKRGEMYVKSWFKASKNILTITWHSQERKSFHPMRSLVDHHFHMPTIADNFFLKDSHFCLFLFLFFSSEKWNRKLFFWLRFRIPKRWRETFILSNSRWRAFDESMNERDYKINIKQFNNALN